MSGILFDFFWGGVCIIILSITLRQRIIPRLEKIFNQRDNFSNKSEIEVEKLQGEIESLKLEKINALNKFKSKELEKFRDELKKHQASCLKIILDEKEASKTRLKKFKSSHFSEIHKSFSKDEFSKLLKKSLDLSSAG